MVTCVHIPRATLPFPNKPFFLCCPCVFCGNVMIDERSRECGLVKSNGSYSEVKQHTILSSYVARFKLEIGKKKTHFHVYMCNTITYIVHESLLGNRDMTSLPQSNRYLPLKKNN